MSDKNITEPKNETTEMKSLKECDVGVSAFITKMEGFTGILKSRFSDFHVNEIGLDNQEIKLTSLSIPVLENQEAPEVKLEKNKKDLEMVLTPEVWQNIDDLLKNSSLQGSVDICVDNLSKDQREKIHSTLREVYGKKIISTTDTVNDQKFISVSRSRGGRGENRVRWMWPGEYVYFALYKENTDTVQAASDIANGLRIHPSYINYAGTKDKRGKTTQLFCVKKREPSEIMRIARRYPYLKVGNFEFKNKVLRLGELKGNRFKIALRDVQGDENNIVKCLECVKTTGFINYYGLQRFGNSTDIPTYLIGIALCKNDYKEACELILKPRESDKSFLRKMREAWWKNRNSKEAAAMIRNHKFIEKKLLDGLSKFGENDYANSLRCIPRNMLMLYTHAFQSLVWNHIASMRINKYGLNLLVGDIVYADEVLSNDTLPEKDEILLETENDKILDQDSNDIDNISAKNTTNESRKLKDLVKILQESDLKSNKYSIYDVLLPLPGWDVKYPNNEMQKWYDELLEKYGLSQELLKNTVKTYSLSGAYRKLIVKPENMNWFFKRYDSPISPLILSDYEKSKGQKEENDNTNGNYKALILDFTLPPSSYATMALREILKTDTSAMIQARLQKELQSNQLNENLKRKTEENCKTDTENVHSSKKQKT